MKFCKDLRLSCFQMHAYNASIFILHTLTKEDEFSHEYVIIWSWKGIAISVEFYGT